MQIGEINLDVSMVILDANIFMLCSEERKS
jgi:hypothetical protein